MPDVLVVIAVLGFAALIIGCVAWVAVQFGKRAVEMQKDFTSQLVAGLGVANKMGFAGDVMRQMGNVIDVDPNEVRAANGGRQYQRDNGQHRASEQQRAAAESR